MKLAWLVSVAACGHDPEVVEPVRPPPPTVRAFAAPPRLPDDIVDEDTPDDDVVIVHDDDAIPDEIDRCPEEIEGYEDVDGCPDPAPPGE